MDIRFTPIVLVLALAMAGCVAIGSNGDQGLDLAMAEGHAEPRKPFFDNETLEGVVTMTTSVYAGLAEGHRFDVASGTRIVTMDISWSGSLDEVHIHVRHVDNCGYYDDDCIHHVTTEGGEATLTIRGPDVGTYRIAFFAEEVAASGSYVIEVQHEIWPDEEPSGNANARDAPQSESVSLEHPASTRWAS